MAKAVELVKATRQFAQEQRGRSWWHFWSTLAVLGGLTSVACLDLHWLLRVPCSILAGLVLVRMFIIYHDFQHGTILQGSRPADVFMFVFGLLTLNPPSVWRHTHNHHHRTNAQVPGPGIGTFPVMTTQEYARASRWQRFHYALSRHPLTLLMGYFTVFLYSLTIRSFLTHPREHFDSGLSLLLVLGVVASLILFAPLAVLLLGFVVPMLVGGALGAYLFYAQHNFPDVQYQNPEEWDYVFASLKSSSYMTMNPVLHWFTGNIGYHHVHHLNAHIPFYRLPEAMAALEPLQSPGTTSLTPWGIYRCLRLKLWDPEQRRMVNFQGV
jgi:omega-6 fatty acid desaturase (delta-12 desaturase)